MSGLEHTSSKTRLVTCQIYILLVAVKPLDPACPFPLVDTCPERADVYYPCEIGEDIIPRGTGNAASAMPISV
jgi:hypothetical protein